VSPTCLHVSEMSMGQCFIFLVTGPEYWYPFVDYSLRNTWMGDIN